MCAHPRELFEYGTLVSNGVDQTEMVSSVSWLRQILKGAKPGDLPVEQPTKFELVINLRTAKALGRSVPQSLLLRADDVIPAPMMRRRSFTIVRSRWKLLLSSR